MTWTKCHIQPNKTPTGSSICTMHDCVNHCYKTKAVHAADRSHPSLSQHTLKHTLPPMRFPTCTQVVIQHCNSLGEKRVHVEGEIHCKDRPGILRQSSTDAVPVLPLCLCHSLPSLTSARWRSASGQPQYTVHAPAGFAKYFIASSYISITVNIKIFPSDSGRNVQYLQYL